MARIAPAGKDEWSPEMAEFFSDFRSAVRSGKPEGNRQSGANLLGTLVRYPALAKAFLTFNGHVLYGTSLSVRQRELLVLRVASLRKCDYEWAQHVILAADAGIRPEEIDQVVEGPEASGWTPIERAMMNAVDELLADGAVGSDTWSVLASEFDERQLMDLVFTVGTYELVAMALRSFAVEPEPDLVPYLPDGR